MRKDPTYRTLPGEASWSWQRGPSGLTAMLRVRDDESGLTIAEVKFSPEQVTQLLASQLIDVPVTVPAPDVIDRIGKRMERERITVPDGLTAGHYANEPSEAMLKFAVTARRAGNWDAARWTKHNWGWALTGTRWVDAPSAPDA